MGKFPSKATTNVEGLRKLYEKAQADPQFFHDLVWNTEKCVESLDDLTREEKVRLISTDPEDLIVAIASGISSSLDFRIGSDPLQACGGSCGLSCGGSCGGTCGGSCGGSCAASCVGSCVGSCIGSGLLVARGDDRINPADALDFRNELVNQLENFEKQQAVFKKFLRK